MLSTTFPHVVCISKLEDKGQTPADDLFDIKFYPWLQHSNEQYFAIAATSQLIICQADLTVQPPFRILKWIESDTSLNSVAWSRSVVGRPLLCTAGAQPRHICIIDIKTEDTRALAGHGRAVNDLAVSPTDPFLLASASEDFSIRLWNLHPDHASQPCIAILAGDGHRQPVLACSFHFSGNWLLTGGMDSAVALWSVPSSVEIGQEPKVIFHPHFYSAEVHDNLVDCIQFYGDLIISRSANGQGENANEILMWKIDGFDGAQSPCHRPAPTTLPDRFTRSAWNDDSSLAFKRIMTLDMPETDRFYLRFGLFLAPGERAMLCMGNQSTRFCFWDLQRLEESSREYGAAEIRIKQDSPQPSKVGAAPMPRIQDPFKPIKPHRIVVAQTDEHSTAHASTWSPDGHWLVAVGDRGTMVMMYRE